MDVGRAEAEVVSTAVMRQQITLGAGGVAKGASVVRLAFLHRYRSSVGQL